MGFGIYGLSVSASFIAGVYAAQNYNLPNIKVVLSHGLTMLESLEKSLRK